MPFTITNRVPKVRRVVAAAGACVVLVATLAACSAVAPATPEEVAVAALTDGRALCEGVQSVATLEDIEVTGTERGEDQTYVHVAATHDGVSVSATVTVAEWTETPCAWSVSVYGE